MVAKTAVKKIEPESVMASPAPAEEPLRIRLGTRGSKIELAEQSLRHCCVWLQADMKLEDTLTPDVWCNVQESDFALAKWSSVTLIEHSGDRAWCNWIVVHADHAGVKIKPNKGGFLEALS